MTRHTYTMDVRINKFLADHGIASRRAIDTLISKKRIRVNGVILSKPGYIVHESDRITVDGKEIIKKQKKNVYILFNKPSDCVTTVKDTHGRKTVLDYIQSDVRVFPIGRLDKDTTGVLILTNDGECAHTLMHPRYSVEKIYRAHIHKALGDEDKKLFEDGIVLKEQSARGGPAFGGKTAPCKTSFFKKNRRDVVITLHEGKNRQIHRMFGALGYAVEKLERIRYAGLDAGDLKQGEWRHLTKKEAESLISNSSND